MFQEFLLDTETAYSIIATKEAEPQPGVIGIRMGPYNAALYRRRQELGLTQKQLAEVAELLGVSWQRIGKIEEEALLKLRVSWRRPTEKGEELLANLRSYKSDQTSSTQES